MMLFLTISLLSASRETSANCTGRCIVDEMINANAEKPEGGNTLNAEYQVPLLPGSVLLQY